MAKLPHKVDVQRDAVQRAHRLGVVREQPRHAPAADRLVGEEILPPALAAVQRSPEVRVPGRVNWMGMGGESATAARTNQHPITIGTTYSI